jgi:hypothetical protein
MLLLAGIPKIMLHDLDGLEVMSMNPAFTKEPTLFHDLYQQSVAAEPTLTKNEEPIVFSNHCP